ncbi:hypothetical protein [Runella sp.]|jgi:hypothetical protein|uniref:hypothetical protein n=1 Tax=Runella sp. TaxID=1960881 RepID=UPI003017E7D0
MSTAQILYEQYKVLPKKVKAELKALINKEDEDVLTDISLPAIQRGLDSIKKLKEGKVKTTNARQFLAELKEELAQ